MFGSNFEAHCDENCRPNHQQIFPTQENRKRKLDESDLGSRGQGQLRQGQSPSLRPLGQSAKVARQDSDRCALCLAGQGGHLEHILKSRCLSK